MATFWIIILHLAAVGCLAGLLILIAHYVWCVDSLDERLVRAVAVTGGILGYLVLRSFWPGSSRLLAGGVDVKAGFWISCFGTLFPVSVGYTAMRSVLQRLQANPAEREKRVLLMIATTVFSVLLDNYHAASVLAELHSAWPLMPLTGLLLGGLIRVVWSYPIALPSAEKSNVNQPFRSSAIAMQTSYGTTESAASSDDQNRQTKLPETDTSAASLSSESSTASPADAS